MPWSIGDIHREACRPRGAKRHLVAALEVLGLGDRDDAHAGLNDAADRGIVPADVELEGAALLALSR